MLEMDAKFPLPSTNLSFEKVAEDWGLWGRPRRKKALERAEALAKFNNIPNSRLFWEFVLEIQISTDDGRPHFWKKKATNRV
jgi:hypothetical protein